MSVCMLHGCEIVCTSCERTKLFVLFCQSSLAKLVKHCYFSTTISKGPQLKCFRVKRTSFIHGLSVTSGLPEILAPSSDEGLYLLTGDCPKWITNKDNQENNIPDSKNTIVSGVDYTASINMELEV